MRNKWVVILAGLAVCVVIVVAGLAALGTWFWYQKVQTATVSTAGATDRFAEARREFPGREPFVTIDERRHGTLRCESRGEPGTLSTLHMIAFDDEEGRLIEADVPYWLARLKAVPIRVGSARVFDESSAFTIEDLERCGPGIVIDVQGRRGERVLVWQR